MTDSGDAEDDRAGWFETLDRTVEFEGTFATVRVDRVRMPDGSVAQREVVEQDDAAAVVPLMDDGTVILLRQYRQPFGDYVLEIPAGKLDKEGEDPEETAARELVEETGYRAQTLERLTTFRNSTGWTDEVTTIFLGTGLTHEGVPDDFEPEAEEQDMEIVRLPLPAAVEEARTGTITDAKTIIGLLLAADR